MLKLNKDPLNMATHPAQPSQPTISLQQPIYIQPETKTDKPVPGASLYTDFYNVYRAAEHATLFYISPEAYLLGAAIGTVKSALSYFNNGAPKKIAQDNEFSDFGGTVHSKGLQSVAWILGKKYTSALALGNFDISVQFLPIDTSSEIKALSWLSKGLPNQQVINITALATGVKVGFIAMKAAQLTDEVIQRIANWVDIPAK
jgi:hypothetical protein